MTNRETPVTRRKTSLWPSRLWIAAGIFVLAGFVIRPLGSYLGHAFRFTGIVMIAIGAIIAVIAWTDERWSRPRTRD